MSLLNTEERIGTLAAELERMAALETDPVLKQVLLNFADRVAVEVLFIEGDGNE